MSIKIYNPEDEKWDKIATLLAKGIEVTDLEGNYESTDIDGCLTEIANNLKQIKSDVKYIYENGTIGGGGGGGGVATPTITIEGDKTLIVNSNQSIDIYYFFTSPNVGNGVVNLSNGSKVTKTSIAQGRNKWTVGPFARGTHVLSISVQDKQGIWSVPVQVTIISGSLEIQSTFSDLRDFTLNEEIIINFDVLTEISEEVLLEYTYNGVTKTVPAEIGPNTLNLGYLPFLGVSLLSMKVYNSRHESNILRYTLVAADSASLFVSTTFNMPIIELGKNILVDYRNSMKGQYSFKTELYKNGVLFATVTSKPGVNFWSLGNNLPLGIYTLEIITKTNDGLLSDSITVTFEVVSVGYVPYTHVTSGLLAAFDARGKLNNSSNRVIWEDLSGNGTVCNLYDFNYASNGWIDNNLVTSGKAYAEIDMQPFIEGIKAGFSMDIKFKVKCVGDIDANVISCQNPITPFQGLYINTWRSSISTKNSEVSTAQIQDDVWTKATFVVNRSTRTMMVYINGVISSVTYLQENDLAMENYIDEFTYNGKIVIGGSTNSIGAIEHCSNSTIKSVRIYGKALNDDEVLQNYIADIDEEAAQLAVRELNTTTEGMPTIAINGILTGMGEDEERRAQISYNDPIDPLKTFLLDDCAISWQGTSSLNYPVKNYTIKLKEGGNPLLTYAPKDNWRPEERWTLKANYMDSSGANNVGLNKYIHDFFADTPYPQQVLDPTTRGNVDGFPVQLTINGENAGIYTWNIDRYSFNNYGFVTYNANGTVNRNPSAVSYEIGVNSSTGAGAFRDDSWNSIRSEFETRYNYRGDEGTVTETVNLNGTNVKVLKTGMHNELQSLVSWVKNCTDEQFLTELDEHFSVSHLIDYYLIAYTFGMIDNLGKNMVLTTWGPNSNGDTIWYPSFYDCDSALGINNSGIIAYDAGLDMATGDYNTSDSLLWVKLRKMFEQQVRTRYLQLRLPRTINGESHPPMLSYENIMRYIGGEVINKIGQKFYNEDARIKYLIPEGIQWLYMCNGTREEFTERWLMERFLYLDSVFEFNYVSKAVVRSYAQGVLTLSIKTYSPQYILVSFSDAADTKVKLYVGKDKFTTFTMTVTNGTDNNIEIYGANNIMYLDGLKSLDVRQLSLANAAKLVELDVSYSNRIEEIELGSNTYLNRLYCNNCVNLGYTVDNKTLNLANCVNLKELDCSNTHIANVLLSKVGGVLEYLNCSYTDITSFNLSGQEYLKDLTFVGCLNLSELVIEDCNGLDTISLVDTKLSRAAINGCTSLRSLDVSYSKALKTLDLRGCANIKIIKMIGSTNPYLTDIDLSDQINLEELDISFSEFLNNITFGKYVDENDVLVKYNKLKILRANNSGLKSLRFGVEAIIPTSLDLEGFTLSSVNFSNCRQLESIENINLVLADSSNCFLSCENLRTITGFIKMTGIENGTFQNCGKLVTVPNLDLSEVVSMQYTFYMCNAIPMDVVVKFLTQSSISNKLITLSNTFAYCTGIAGSLPSNLFNLCTEVTSIDRIFYSCEHISGTVPVELLAPMTKLVNAAYTFYETNINGEVPLDLLRYNTELANVSYMFVSTDITYVPLSNIFQYLTKLEDASYVFDNCRSLQLTIPDDMFVNNAKLLYVRGMFSRCTAIIGSIPRNVFNNMPLIDGSNSLTSVERFFEGCSGLTGTIPAYIDMNNLGLLDRCGYVTEGSSIFSGCSNLTGTIPENLLVHCQELLDVSFLFLDCANLTGSIPSNLFINNNKLLNGAGIFKNCTSLGGAIPGNLLKGKTKLLSIAELFSGCTNLTYAIPPGLLDDNVALVNVSQMFSRCTYLDGDIPERISTFEGDVETVIQYGLLDNCINLTSIAGLFEYCELLPSRIPPGLLRNAQRITNANDLFRGCYSLSGSVPVGLFDNCRNLTSLSRTFKDCINLENDLSDPLNPYAIHPDLFKYCYNLTDVSYMFEMNGFDNPDESKLNGTLSAIMFLTNLKLASIDGFITACRNITGPVDSNLFQLNRSLKTAVNAFSYTGITSLGANLFSTCLQLKNMTSTFQGCGLLTGSAPEYWSETHVIKATAYGYCFNGCTSLTNYSSIPASWK